MAHKTKIYFKMSVKSIYIIKYSTFCKTKFLVDGEYIPSKYKHLNT